VAVEGSDVFPSAGNPGQTHKAGTEEEHNGGFGNRGRSQVVDPARMVSGTNQVAS